MTNTQANRELMSHVFSELAKGNRLPFREAMADDMVWTTVGTSIWSDTFRGRKQIAEELIGPLFEQYADTYTSTPKRIIADGDTVVVETRGGVTTKAGKRYENSYCMIFRLEGGKMKELVEYCDTILVDQMLVRPGHASAAAT